mmetsp:Transcript_13102/g.55054  ORF Transcript_13102/g.55054 Transcript_13102/m.55054 type:complete len:243 (-) Transcript_13102:1125-1853(-)
MASGETFLSAAPSFRSFDVDPRPPLRRFGAAPFDGSGADKSAVSLRNATNATGASPLTKSGAPTTAQSRTRHAPTRTSHRHRSICSVPTRLPLTLITSSERPWNVYPGRTDAVGTRRGPARFAFVFVFAFPSAADLGACFRATSPCTNPPAPLGQYDASNLRRSPLQGTFAFKTPSPHRAASPKTVSARLGYGATSTTSLWSLIKHRTQGNGYVFVSGSNFVAAMVFETSRENTMAPCSVAQ